MREQGGQGGAGRGVHRSFRIAIDLISIKIQGRLKTQDWIFQRLRLCSGLNAFLLTQDSLC